MDKRFVLAIDQGTTGSTAMILQHSGQAVNVVAKVNIPFRQHFPQNGWVEHDLDEIWASVLGAIKQVLEKAESEADFSSRKITAIGITNQRETLCVFDRKTAKPSRRAIVWQCRRSQEICEDLKANGLEPEIRSKTGLLLDPYFSGSKIKWILDNEPDLAKEIQAGKSVVGTIDSFLVAKLSDASSFATDISNASRTMLCDISQGNWDDGLCEVFGLKDASVLPEILPSDARFGETKNLPCLPDGIPIHGVLGDQQAALFGQLALRPGQSKCTFGTGAFFLANIGDAMIEPERGVLQTVAWKLARGENKLVYAHEGSVFIAGAIVQFLRDNLGFIESSADVEALAITGKGAPELVFVPALTGMGAPYWKSRARGALFGMTRGTSRNDIAKAALESMAFQVNDLMRAIYSPGGDGGGAFEQPEELNIDGGAAANNLLCQVLADTLGCKINRSAILESTGYGAGLIALLGSGGFSNINELNQINHIDKQFTPELAAQPLQSAKNRAWDRAVQATLSFMEE